MFDRTNKRQRHRLIGNNVIEPIDLDAKFTDFRIRGAVLELVTGDRQLHPRERNQRKPGGSRQPFSRNLLFFFLKHGFPPSMRGRNLDKVFDPVNRSGFPLSRPT